MKSQLRFILVLMSVVFLLSACDEVRGTAGKGDEVNDACTTQKSVLGVIKETNCYVGPGTDYEVVRLLEEGQYFDILGIDDDVAWIDDDVAWIDDDVAWFQIDPNALIDPEPPYRPLNELSPQPDPPGSIKIIHCWVPNSNVEAIGDLINLPIIFKPMLRIVEEINCLSGPGTDYEVLQLLDAGQYFDILGIDDDVAWIDDDVAWIDDDVAWFQIDPNALIDPEPPYRPLSKLTSQSNSSGSEMSVRCWVPRTGVQFTGDLLRLTVVSVPIPTPTPTSQSQPIIQPTKQAVQPTSPPAINCSNLPYEVCIKYSQYGCAWDKEKSVCYKQ